MGLVGKHPAARPEQGRQHRHGHRRHFADPVNIQPIEPARGLASRAGQHPHRPGGQVRLLLAGRDQDLLARLGLLGRHGGDQLVCPHADRDAQPHLVADLGSQFVGNVLGSVVAGQIEIEVIQGGDLDGRGLLLTNGEHLPGGLFVARILAGQDDQPRAKMPGLGEPHAGADAVSARFVTTAGDDAGADRHRPAAQPGFIALLDRGEKGVSIQVKDEARRKRSQEHRCEDGVPSVAGSEDGNDWHGLYKQIYTDRVSHGKWENGPATVGIFAPKGKNSSAISTIIRGGLCSPYLHYSFLFNNLRAKPSKLCYWRKLCLPICRNHPPFPQPCRFGESR